MATLTNKDFIAAKATQISWVLDELLKGRHLTPMDALKECGCFRLAAIIHILKKEGGWNIVNVWHASSKNKKRFAKYVMQSPQRL